METSRFQQFKETMASTFTCQALLVPISRKTNSHITQGRRRATKRYRISSNSTKRRVEPRTKANHSETLKRWSTSCSDKHIPPEYTLYRRLLASQNTDGQQLVNNNITEWLHEADRWWLIPMHGAEHLAQCSTWTHERAPHSKDNVESDDNTASQRT